MSKNPNYKAVIYSEFIADGVEILERALEKDRIPYGKIIGSIAKEERAGIVSEYNQGNLHVLIISEAGGEGLDLKNTSELYLLDPTWHGAATDQIIGRAVRFRSHSTLPPEQRVVKIFHVKLVKPEEKMDFKKIHKLTLPQAMEYHKEHPLSIDIIMDKISTRKTAIIQKATRILREVSIESEMCNK
jgi:superfamily II DNA/RNA helicase